MAGAGCGGTLPVRRFPENPTRKAVRAVESEPRTSTVDTGVLRLLWLAQWNAYEVSRSGRILGLVRLRYPIPFRQIVELV
jgi:hypothetical protein